MVIYHAVALSVTFNKHYHIFPEVGFKLGSLAYMACIYISVFVNQSKTRATQK